MPDIAAALGLRANKHQRACIAHQTHLAKVIADLPADYHPPAIPYESLSPSVSSPTSLHKLSKKQQQQLAAAKPYAHPLALTRSDTTTEGGVLRALHAHTSRADAALLALPLADIVDGCARGKVISLRGGDNNLNHAQPQEAEIAVTPAHMLRAYTRRAVLAHAATNCLSDIMVPPAAVVPLGLGDGDDALAGVIHASLVDSASESENGGGGKERELLFLGVPISVKDTVNVPGRPTTIGYSSRSSFTAPFLSSDDNNKSSPAEPHPHTPSTLYNLLVNAGALVHCKTTVPPGLLALETQSSLFGVTRNPWDLSRSCGASTGGGGALVASGGCVVDIGSDVAGSLRIPAGWCGIYSLKPSSGRLPITGHTSSMPGMEGVPIVVGPMTRRMEDLYEFMRRILLIMGGGADANSSGTWDPSCVPLAWRDVGLREEGRKLKWGILWDDGIIAPTPACRRALALASAALKKEGHEVVDFNPPNVFEGLKVGYQLMFSDGGEQLREPLSATESLTPTSMELLSLLQLPARVKRLLSTITMLLSTDILTATLLRILHPKTIMQERANIVARDEYRRRWAERWREEGLDFVITVPMALPSVKHGDSMKTSLIGAGYTFLFSLLDYSAGCIPVTTVDRTLDALPVDFFPKKTSLLSALGAPFMSVFRWLFGGSVSPSPAQPSADSSIIPSILAPTPSRPQPAYNELTAIAQKAYTAYDADAMHGLPIGIQLVGRRLEEEKVLEGMFVLRDALRRMGVPWEGYADL